MQPRSGSQRVGEQGDLGLRRAGRRVIAVHTQLNVAAQGFAVPKECLPAALRFEVDLIQTGDGRMAAEVSKAGG